MEWNRSETIALASLKCAQCTGLGLRNGRAGTLVPCGCVLRQIFRACYDRFKSCVKTEKSITSVRLEHIGGGGRNRGIIYGRKTEEYIADFILMTKRTLTADEWRLFNWHYLLGADWKLCCQRMGVERGNFFHACYRIEHKLGRAFRETEPFGLFPLDEYFGNKVVGSTTPACYVPQDKPLPVRPPVKKAA